MFIDHPDDWYAIALEDAVIGMMDCSEGCQRKPVDLDDFLSGRVQAMNREYAIFAAEVRDGVVVSFSEIYLP